MATGDGKVLGNLSLRIHLDPGFLVEPLSRLAGALEEKARNLVGLPD